MPDVVYVDLVDWGLLQVHLRDGRIWPITNLFDDCGEEVYDVNEAVCFVAGRAGEGWLTEPMSAYQAVVLH